MRKHRMKGYKMSHQWLCHPFQRLRRIVMWTGIIASQKVTGVKEAETNIFHNIASLPLPNLQVQYIFLTRAVRSKGCEQEGIQPKRKSFRRCSTHSSNSEIYNSTTQNNPVQRSKNTPSYIAWTYFAVGLQQPAAFRGLWEQALYFIISASSTKYSKWPCSL